LSLEKFSFPRTFLCTLVWMNSLKGSAIVKGCHYLKLKCGYTGYCCQFLKLLFSIIWKLNCLLVWVWLKLRSNKSFVGFIVLKTLNRSKTCLYLSIWFGVALKLFKCKSKKDTKGSTWELQSFSALADTDNSCYFDNGFMWVNAIFQSCDKE
jgi:hypothetical protein